MTRIFTLIMVVALHVSAGAQGLPPDADIERERRAVQAQRKDLFGGSKPLASAPRNPFPQVGTPERTPVDIEALAQRYAGKAQAQRPLGLLVFGSFSMPAGSLKRLVQDTQRAGGVVLLRGFKGGSYKTTALAIADLKTTGAAVQVHPEAFKTYRVAAVPTVVLVAPDAGDELDAEGCVLPQHYAKVQGDVSLTYALDQIARRAPKFAQMALVLGRPLRESLP